MPSYHCAGCWWWFNGVGDVSLAHFRPLSANWASFKCHDLPAALFLTTSIPLWPPFAYPLGWDLVTVGAILVHSLFKKPIWWFNDSCFVTWCFDFWFLAVICKAPFSIHTNLNLLIWYLSNVSYHMKKIKKMIVLLHEVWKQ